MNNYPPQAGSQQQAQYGAPPHGHQMNQPTGYGGQIPQSAPTAEVPGYPGAPKPMPMQPPVAPAGYAPAGYGAPVNPLGQQQQQSIPPPAPQVSMPSVPMATPFQQQAPPPPQMPQPPMPSYPVDNSGQIAMQNPRTAGLVGTSPSLVPPIAPGGYPQPQQPSAMQLPPGQQQQQQQYYQYGQQSGYGGKPMSMPVPIIGQPAPLNLVESIVDCPSIVPPNNTSFSRCSLTKIPKTNAVMAKTKLSFGVTVTPFPLDEPTVPLGSTNIVRCNRCRTYLNPYVEMVDQGARWKFPSTYDYDPVTQQQIDRRSRAELNTPVYEFIATADYMARPPQPAAYLFLIDVTYAAVNSGMVATATRTILDHLDQIPNLDNRTKIGFITYDSVLQFYSFLNGEAKMMVVADTSDIFLPCNESDLLVGLSECRSQIEDLLGSFQTYFAKTQASNSALGAGLNAAMKLMTNVGGKIVVLQSSPPNLGEGAIKPRDDIKVYGTSGENALLKQQNNFYKMLATECSKTQTCIDMFLCPPTGAGGASQYMDIASIGNAAKYTGGKLFYYPGFNASNSEDAIKLASDLATFLSKEVCFESVIRIRASQGLAVNAYHGNFFLRSTDLLSLPNINPDHSYSAQIILEDHLISPIVCFQTAVLHTTCNGERRIRVINSAYPVTELPDEVFDGVDHGAMIDLLAKMAVEKVLMGTLEDARDALNNKVIEIAKAVRSQYKLGTQGQLMLPESLRLLPLLVQGLLRTVAIRPGNFTPVDLRSYYLILMKTLSVPQMLALVYPFMFAVHTLSQAAGTPDEATGKIVMPERLPLTSEKLERHGLYILDNGLQVLVWVGSAIHPELCSLIFGKSYAELESGKTSLPVLDNPWSEKVRMILGKRRQLASSPYTPVTVVVKEDSDAALKVAFLSQLIEDRSIDGQGQSYTQWLGVLREKSTSA